MVTVTELEEIPEDLKFCSELQVLDVTGNPLQRSCFFCCNKHGHTE